MKVLHVNAGNEYGGGLHHIISLLKVMKEKCDVELLVFEEGPVAEAARENQISVNVLGQKSRLDISVIHRLEMFIKGGNYDIVHTHGPRANTYINRISKSLKNSQWVITIHSNPELDFKDRKLLGNVLKSIHLKTFKEADYVIAASNEIQNISQRYGVLKSCSTVIHNGISFREHTKNQTRNDTFSLLSVGRLEKVKGYHVLLDALAQMPHDQWELIICGDGSQRDRLETQAKKLGLENNIVFKGWVLKDQLDLYYQRADIYILSSLSESFPLVMLEAMEFSIPVIATDVGDVRDMFPKQAESLLVAKNDANLLSKAIKSAYDSWIENNLKGLGEVYNQHGEQFSIEKQVEKTLSIYQQLSIYF